MAKQLSSTIRSSEGGAKVVKLRRTGFDEVELVERLRRSEPEAVEHLIHAYSSLVRQSLFRVLGSTHDLDDLEQDTFVTVLGRCHTLRDPFALRSFVVSVAMRIARNELRKRAIRRFVGLDVAGDHMREPAYDVVRAERLRHIYAALNRLSPNIRIAFVLRHVEGYELAEVAGACGCSLSTVKRWLTAADERLQGYVATDPALQSLATEQGEP